MKFDIGAMSVGDILDRGLKILLARLPTFFLIYLIVLAPSLLLQLFLGAVQAELFGLPTPELLMAIVFGSLMVLVLALILSPIGTAAILHVIGQEFVDRRVSVGEALSFALGRFGSLLGTSILFGLIYLVGLVLCIVPGIIWAVWYGFFAQVVVMENLGGMDALNRSRQLVSGFGWRVFGVLLLLTVLLILASFIPVFLEIILPAHERVQTEFGPGQGRVVNFPFFAIQILTQGAVNIILQGYESICVTLLYFDLRIRKEGFDLELAAQQHASRGDGPGLKPSEQP